MPLLFSIALLILAMVLLTARTPHVSPIIWAGVWGVMLFCYATLGSMYYYDQGVMLYTIAAVLIFNVGYFAAWAILSPKPGQKQAVPVQWRFEHLQFFIIVSSIIGLLGPLSWARASGIGLSSLTSISSLFEAATDAHVALAEQQLEEDAIAKLALLFPLSAITVAGTYLGLGRPGRKVPWWVLLMPLIPFTGMMLLMLIRTMLLLPILALFGGYVAGLTLLRREKTLFTANKVMAGAGIVTVFILIVVVLQAIRHGDPDLENLGEAFSSLRLWAAGYEPALMRWVTSVWDGSLQWGASTFRQIAGAFGAAQEKAAYGGGQISIGYGETSNASTALSTFIQDFGLYGSLVFIAIFGGAAGALCSEVRRGNLMLSPFYVLVVLSVLFSPNSWFMGYGTRIVSPFCVMAYYFFFAKVSRKARLTAGDDLTERFTNRSDKFAVLRRLRRPSRAY